MSHPDTPFRQCCIDLSLGQVPNWEDWSVCTPDQQKMLRGILKENNDKEVVLAWLMQDLAPSGFRWMKELKHVLPSNVEQHDIERLSAHFEKLLATDMPQESLQLAKEECYLAVRALMEAATTHHQPHVFKWTFEQAFIQHVWKDFGMHLTQDLRNQLSRSAFEKHWDMASECVHVLHHHIHAPLSMIKEMIHPSCVMHVMTHYEKRNLFEHLCTPSTQAKPKVM